MHGLVQFAQNIVADLPAIKKFGAGDRVYVQAQQVWLVLTAYVMSSDRKPTLPTRITYGDLARAMGRDPRAGRNLRHALGIVGFFCKANDLPTLNSIVVNEKTGAPGDHVVLRDGHSPKQEQADVMRQDWFRFRVPTTGTFRRVWEAAKAEWES